MFDYNGYSLFGSLGQGLLQTISNANTNRVNMDIAKQNLAMQKDINSQNIAFQQRENEITREREDNAVQRAALDMQKAGLSKTLAAGSPASSSALSAPQAQMTQLDYKHKKLLEGVDLVNAFTQLAQGLANVDKTKAETAGINTSNQYIAEKAEAEIGGIRSSIALNEATQRLRSAEADLKEKYGGQQILTQINNVLADTDYKHAITARTHEEREKIVQEVIESIRRVQKMDKETELLVEDIVYKKLQSQVLTWDLYKSKSLSLRTSDALPTMLGIPIGAASSVLGSISDGISNSFSSWLSNRSGVKYQGGKVFTF